MHAALFCAEPSLLFAPGVCDDDDDDDERCDDSGAQGIAVSVYTLRLCLHNNAQ